MFDRVILIKFDKNLKVYFYYTILPLSLTISSKLKYGKLSLKNTKKVVKWWPKLKGENYILAISNKLLTTMILYYNNQNYFCQT